MVSTKSITFDGVNDYIDMGDVATFQKDYTDAFSISCWAKTVATASVNTLVGKMDSSGGQPGYLMFLNASGQFEAVLRNTAATNSLRVRTNVSRLNDGGWHHFAMTFDGSSSLLLYVDGVLKATTTVYNTLSASILASGKSLQVGAYDGSTAPFAGNIDEVAFFSDDLSAAEVLSIFASARPADLMGSQALAAWWQLGENVRFPTVVDRITSVATFPTIPDETTNGNDGTMTNMTAADIVQWAPSSNFSRYCYEFDGSAEYITMGNVLAFEYTDEFSFSAWIKTTGSQVSILSKLNQPSSSSQGYDFLINPSGYLEVILSHDTSSSNWLAAGATGTICNDGSWHHVAVCYNGSGVAAGLTFYLDGVSYPTNAIGFDNLSASIVHTGPFEIARRYQGSPYQYFPGNISEVAVYDIELDAANIAWIYNGGTPRDLRLSGAPSNLEAWWRIGEGGEQPQSSWVHKVHQWVWDATATKESATITDASHLNSPGTLYNMDATNVTADTPGGISNYSCTFNGVDEGMFCNVASTAYAVYSFFGNDQFSLSGWVKTSSSTGWLWGNGWNSAANWGGYGVFLSGGKPTFSITSNYPTYSITVQTTSATVNDNSWHHIAVCYRDGASNVQIWIDGVQQSVSVITNNLISAPSYYGFSIGARGSGTYDPLAGQCDEVAVYSKFLTSSDIASIYNVGEPPDLRDLPCVLWLRGWWRMGDAYVYPGTTVNMDYQDQIPNSPGSLSYSLKMTTSDYVIVPHAANLDFDFDEQFSISAWVFPLGLNSYQAIWYKKSGVGISIQYYGGSGGATYDPRGVIQILFDGTTGLFEVYPGGLGVAAIPYGEWFHFVMTHDGTDATGIKCYINGQEMPVWVRYNFTFPGGDTMKNSADVWLGRGAAYWLGNQDEVSAWSKELTQAEVTELYNDGDPTNLLNHSAAANLVGWWQMGDGPGNDGTMTNMASDDIIENAPRKPTVGGVKIDYYLMRGVDSACGTLTYHHWTVTGAPDFTGAQAGTLPCGGPLTDIIVEATWSVFN